MIHVGQRVLMAVGAFLVASDLTFRVREFLRKARASSPPRPPETNQGHLPAEPKEELGRLSSGGQLPTLGIPRGLAAPPPPAAPWIAPGRSSPRSIAPARRAGVSASPRAPATWQGCGSGGGSSSGRTALPSASSACKGRSARASACLVREAPSAGSRRGRCALCSPPTARAAH